MFWALSGLLGPLPLSADTLWLANGDRITGTVLRHTTSAWQVDTEAAGILNIAAEHVARVVWSGAEVPMSDPLELVTTPASNLPENRSFSSSGGVDVALEYENSAVDTHEVDIDLRQNVAQGVWRHRWRGRYHREYRDGERRDNDWELAYSPERFVSRQRFWHGRVSAKRDWEEDISRRFALGLGPGYQFWDTEQSAFSLSALLTRNRFSYANHPEERFYAWALQWQFNRYFWQELFELYATGRTGRAFSGATGFQFNAETGVRYPLTEWMSLNMAVEADWVENSAEDLRDTLYHIGLGVNW
ncbi:DUF481 domain-containing protein [Halomonas vilamensis]|uniref:DUF481 domain-containing protein n=1 Tax=Vreelandella vilamensis TaxID=531309 RepID=A0ABU1H4E0_9GAMM|nr:DUF481 domain-containing protein [Halomonas vilamensis]MDR5898701.1 DUF481 domain-containing protein [Halomonas vilamensis]